MLKYSLWGLLVINAIFFAMHRGYFGAFMADGREPVRLANQLNADKVKVLIPNSGLGPAAVEAVPEKKLAALACTEIGNFSETDATSFEAKLAGTPLAGKFTKRNIKDVANYIVYIPPQGNKESADKKANELRRLGIQDFFVIQDNPELRWAISLGVFKSENMAQARLTELSQKGLRSARVSPYAMTPGKVSYQLLEFDTPSKEAIEKIKAEYVTLEIRACSDTTATQ